MPRSGRLKETQISSRENSIFRALQDCLTTRGIKKHGLFMVFGDRAIRDTLARNASLARNLILCNDDSAPESLELQMNGDFAILRLTRELFNELDVFGTHSPILVLKTPEVPVLDLASAPKRVEILCALSDPANVGALLRSAAAFGVERVILLKESASPFHPRAVRAASATTLLTPLARGPSIKEIASPESIVALDMQGPALHAFAWPRDFRLLIGEEGLGIPAHVNFKRVSIPIANGVESLNATVAASIALWACKTSEL